MIARVMLGLMLAVSGAAHAELRVVTEDFPPYNFLDNGQLKGISTEVVEAVFKKVGEKFNAEVLPWARAMKEAEKGENIMIYSMGRNKQREELYQWVGPISPLEFVLFKKKQRKDKEVINITQLDEAKKLKIATKNKDVREQYLEEKGFQKGLQIVSTEDYASGLEMLAQEKVHLWSCNYLVGLSLMKKAGYSPSDYERGIVLADLSTEGYYMAFSLKTPKDVVERFKKALADVTKEGTIEATLKKYQ